MSYPLIQFTCGDDKTITQAVTQPNATTPEDLTGWSAITLYLKTDHNVHDSEAYVALVGTVQAPATGGIVTWQLPSASSANIRGLWAYHITGIAPGGAVTTLGYGAVMGVVA